MPTDGEKPPERTADREHGPHSRATPAVGTRAPAPTLTDPEALEAARRRSIEGMPRHPTPTGALSLVNVRIPSNLPPATRPVPGHVGAEEPPRPAEALASPEEMARLLALGDYSGALEVAETILSASPDDPAASACRDECRGVLVRMYETRLGDMTRVPVVAVAREQLRWLSIDHRAGFVLSLVDGASTVEMIVDVSGMPAFDTLRILAELVQQRILTLQT